MHFTPAFLLPALALAAPVADIEARAGSGPFTLMSVRSASPIHYGQVNAAGQAFYIHKETATYCPSGVSGLDCSKYSNSTTSLSTASVGKQSSAGLNTVVPGGQLLYVQKNGAVGFTQAHSASVPEGAYQSGFVYTAPVNGQPYGHLSFTAGGASGFVACPTKSNANVYQVFADVKGFKSSDKCLGFDAFALPYSGAPAWQYT